MKVSYIQLFLAYCFLWYQIQVNVHVLRRKINQRQVLTGNNLNKFGFYFIADDWRWCSRTWKEKDRGDFRSSHCQYCASEYEGRFHSPLQLQTSTNIYDLYKYCWGKTMVLVDDKLFLPITILGTSSTNQWLYCVLTTNGTCTNFNHSDGRSPNETNHS